MNSISIQFTEEELKRVDYFLTRVKSLLATNECQFAKSIKNNDFDNSYPMKHSDKMAVLKSLVASDCVKIEPNDNPRYETAEVFVFLKNIEFYVYGEIERMCIYIKMYIQTKPTFDIVLIISFHKDGMFK